MKPAAALVGALLTLALSLPALAQSVEAVNRRIDLIYGEHQTLTAAYQVLKFAIGQHDAATVASLVHYPFRTQIDGERTTLRREEEFIARYDDIVTPPIAQAVAVQTYGTLFVNDQGVMFGQGELWLTPRCLERGCARKVWLIGAINQP